MHHNKPAIRKTKSNSRTWFNLL